MNVKCTSDQSMCRSVQISKMNVLLEENVSVSASPYSNAGDIY